MGSSQQELEIKLYLSNLESFQRRVEALGGQLLEPRLHEINLRFDAPDGQLTREAKVLRLRQDTAPRLTYKGPGMTVDGVHARTEIEFTVSDFPSAQALLEALGYQVSLMYEKYRTTYSLEGLLITLDEMPYGNFTEIEGPEPGAIHAVAEKLAINWEARILDSYTSLFDHLRRKLNFTFRDLSFDNFSTLEILPTHLGVIPADQ
ncbi:MAG: class IV adenylate cyclase [Chloroflexota bacterium]|nr:MAG: class IV adenylate cyclase [Chloroflexota bacterium]